MTLLRSVQLIDRTWYSVSVPAEWIERPSAAGADALGTVGQFADNHHVLRVERVLDGLVPVEELMAKISFDTRGAIDGYEPGPAEAMTVVGAGPARCRMVATSEDGGRRSYFMLELFAEGLDRHMWYVRVSAERPYFDPRLAERILDSFRIAYFHEERDR